MCFFVGCVVVVGRFFPTSSRFCAPFHRKAAEPNDRKEWQNDPRHFVNDVKGWGQGD